MIFQMAIFKSSPLKSSHTHVPAVQCYNNPSLEELACQYRNMKTDVTRLK